MASPNSLFLVISVAAFLLGGSSLFLIHGHCRLRAKIGRRLFFAVLVALGAAGLAAAFVFHDGLAPLGLLVGLLVVASCWELPELDNQTAQ